MERYLIFTENELKLLLAGITFRFDESIERIVRSIPNNPDLTVIPTKEYENLMERKNILPVEATTKPKSKVPKESLFNFNKDFRSGSLNGLFLSTQERVDLLIASGIKVQFGEVLGKHSEVVTHIDELDILEESSDPNVIKAIGCMGINPFDYSASTSDYVKLGLPYEIANRCDSIDQAIDKLFEIRDAGRKEVLPTLTEPFSGYGNILPMEEFIECCNNGDFFDEDGHGRYANDEMMSNIEVMPSDVLNDTVDMRYTHVIWFNK